MADEPIMSVIVRLRRAQPRNPDTMRLCDEHEQRLEELRRLRLAPPLTPVSSAANAVSKKPANAVSKTDRKAYMRDLMRKKRAAARETPRVQDRRGT